MNDFLLLLGGVACAAVGGELFVRGSVGMARWAGVRPAVVGLTVAAFATSSPEVSVSVNAALAGKPEIGLGDATGSNVVNVALILGLALLISGIQGSRGSVRRDFPVAVLVPLLTALMLWDGVLSRWDALLMLVGFCLWLVAALVEAWHQRGAREGGEGAGSGWKVAGACVAGLTLLVAAGKLIVTGAKGIAVMYSIDEFVIGGTLVAVGTSMPEMATTLVAKLRGYDEVGLGTILGSNIFNGLLIVGVAAMIHPIEVPFREVALTLAFGVAALIATYPTRTGMILRGRGILLLALYAGYLAVLLQGR